LPFPVLGSFVRSTEKPVHPGETNEKSGRDWGAKGGTIVTGTDLVGAAPAQFSSRVAADHIQARVDEYQAGKGGQAKRVAAWFFTGVITAVTTRWGGFPVLHAVHCCHIAAAVIRPQLGGRLENQQAGNNDM
jgi:hypothetical protein